jgi:hypothetical protein
MGALFQLPSADGGLEDQLPAQHNGTAGGRQAVFFDVRLKEVECCQKVFHCKGTLFLVFWLGRNEFLWAFSHHVFWLFQVSVSAVLRTGYQVGNKKTYGDYLCDVSRVSKFPFTGISLHLFTNILDCSFILCPVFIAVMGRESCLLIGIGFLPLEE